MNVDSLTLKDREKIILILDIMEYTSKAVCIKN